MRDYRRSWWQSLRVQVLVAVGAAVVAIAAWVGYRAWTVDHELSLARKEISAVQSQAHGIVAGRGGGFDIRPKLKAPARHAANARAAAHDPLFRAVGFIPLLGAPLRTATGVADAASVVTRTTLPALADAADYWKIVHDSNLRAGVPVDFIAKSSPLLGSALTGLEQAKHRLATLPQQTWLGSVDDARALLAAEVSTLLDDVRPAAAVADLAPAMLGRDGDRHYLVAFQNRAEARGTGGLLGALALVDAHAGHLRVVRFTNNQHLPGIPVVPAGFHSDLASQSPTLGIGTRWQNSNYGADYRDAGAAWAAMYTSIYHVSIDGVMAVDPDGMAALMSATGRVTVDVQKQGAVEVDAENVANFVERDEYRLPISRDVRKDLQQQIAQQVLDRLLSGDTSPLDLVDSLSRAARLQHVLLMSQHPDEEKRILAFPVSGAVPRTAAPYVRLTINNAAGSKLDYYLQTSLRYTVTNCGSPRRVRIAATFENTAPTGLPKIVGPQDMPTGLVPPQANFDLAGIYLTQGAWLVSAHLDGRPIGTDPSTASPVDGVYLRTAIDHGHPVVTAPLVLLPGQERRLVLDIEERPSKAEPLTPTQPMTNQTAVSTDLDACRST